MPVYRDANIVFLYFSLIVLRYFFSILGAGRVEKRGKWRKENKENDVGR